MALEATTLCNSCPHPLLDHGAQSPMAESSSACRICTCPCFAPGVALPDTTGKVAYGLAWIFVPGKDDDHVDMAKLYLHPPVEEGAGGPIFLCAIPAHLVRNDPELPTKITKLIAFALGGVQFREFKPQTGPKKGD